MNTTNPSEKDTAGTDLPTIEETNDHHTIVFLETQPSAPFDVQAEPIEPLGNQLRNARESKNLSCEDVARKLRLPHTVVEALEADDYERIGYSIYLRGYLKKYLGLLGLPESLGTDVLDAHSAPPPLVITNRTMSRPRFLFERYSGSALYLILTGVIIVPSVLLAMHAGISRHAGRIAPLDRPLENAPSVSGSPGKPNVPRSAATVATTRSSTEHSSVDPKNQAPLAASMTPFNTSNNKTHVDKSSAALAAPAAIAKPKPVTNVHDLHLQLVKSSWVEIVNGSGQKLEYGLLPAGSERDYHADGSLQVLLGNSAGARISIDGKSRDLTPYQHGNVARFQLAQGDWSMSPSGG